jgi:AraC-like DNA-binding protein
MYNLQINLQEWINFSNFEKGHFLLRCCCLKKYFMTEPLSMDQPFLRKLTDIVIANLSNENFGVNELALESGFNRKVLNRKLKKITGKSASQLIRDIRLQRALELLREGIYTVAEVGYKIGFNSPVYFTKCFHEYFGYPPVKVKKGDLTDSEFKMMTDKSAENGSTGKFLKKLAPTDQEQCFSLPCLL